MTKTIKLKDRDTGEILLPYSLCENVYSRIGVSVKDMVDRTWKGRLKVLVIGNSFSRDAFDYLPPICQCIGIELTIGMLYIPGCTVQTHVNNWNNGAAAYEYDKHTGDKWTTVRGYSIRQGLTDEWWDIVVTHQESSRSGKYETIKPYIDIMTGRVRQAYPKAKTAWMMTPAWGIDNNYGGSYTSQQDMYDSIVRTCKTIMDSHDMDILIPNGTAIQNARQTTLQQYGSDLFASAGDRHLEDGIGRLTAAYSCFLSLAAPLCRLTPILDFLPKYGTNVNNSSGDSNYYPQTSSFAEVTADMAILGLRCAISANGDPYVVSDV